MRHHICSAGQLIVLILLRRLLINELGEIILLLMNEGGRTSLILELNR